MGRKSTKENKNIFFRTREDLGLTREEASELLEWISSDRIEKIENGRDNPRPDEVLAIADKYNKPELCNYYCAKCCDIGKRYVPEIEIKDLSKIVLEMLASLNSIQKRRDRLIEITADGSIDEDEIEDFVRIQEDLERISITAETLQFWCEQKLAAGKIDIDAYNAHKNKK